MISKKDIPNVDIRASDLKNRRLGEGRPAKSLHEALCAVHFTIGDDPRKYCLRQNGGGEFPMYSQHADNRMECIGYATPSSKNTFTVSLRKFGILFTSRIKLAHLTLYGSKTPSSWQGGFSISSETI